MCPQLISFDDQFQAEVWGAERYLLQALNFNAWPRYYKQLMFCLSPWHYLVRYFQIQFCIINRIPFRYYIWFLKLNVEIGKVEIPHLFYKKLEQLYEYVYRKALHDGTTCRSYSVFNDIVMDYNGSVVFNSEMRNYVNENMPLCLMSKSENYWFSINVRDMKF